MYFIPTTQCNLDYTVTFPVPEPLRVARSFCIGQRTDGFCGEVGFLGVFGLFFSFLSISHLEYRSYSVDVDDISGNSSSVAHCGFPIR